MRSAIVFAAILVGSSPAAADDRWRTSAWDATAHVLDRIAGEEGIAPSVRVCAASAAVRARVHAMRTDVAVVRSHHERRSGDSPLHGRSLTPRPLDARAARLVASIDMFVRLVPGEHSERVATARFWRGSIYRRAGHLDRAISDFVAIVEHMREHEVGPFAVNLLLDSLNRLERYDELVAWARRLRSDAALLVRDEELAERLRHIDVVGTRKDAERIAQWAHATGVPLVSPALVRALYLAAAAAGDLAVRPFR